MSCDTLRYRILRKSVPHGQTDYFLTNRIIAFGGVAVAVVVVLAWTPYSKVN